MSVQEMLAEAPHGVSMGNNEVGGRTNKGLDLDDKGEGTVWSSFRDSNKGDQINTNQP